MADNRPGLVTPLCQSQHF